MAKASSAQLKTLMRICEALEQRYGRRKQTDFVDFIESLIFQILELGTAERHAREALKRIQVEYVDWNDMRVASVREIQDILGPRYPRCREKAEDLSSLLADLYTAFRRMDLTDLVRTTDGIETLRALPETTLIREDMVERALLEVCEVHTFPCDEEQFRLLKFLGGVHKSLAMDVGRRKIEEICDKEDMLRISRGLREHTDFLYDRDIDDPKPIGHGWSKPDPLGMGGKPKAQAAGKKAAGKKKSAATSATSKSGQSKKKKKSAASKAGKTAKTGKPGKKAAKKQAAAGKPSKKSAAGQKSASKKTAGKKQAAAKKGAAKKRAKAK